MGFSRGNFVKTKQNNCRKLLSSDRNPPIDDLINSGILPILVECLKSPKYVVVGFFQNFPFLCHNFLWISRPRSLNFWEQSNVSTLIFWQGTTLLKKCRWSRTCDFNSTFFQRFTAIRSGLGSDQYRVGNVGPDAGGGAGKRRPPIPSAALVAQHERLRAGSLGSRQYHRLDLDLLRFG